MKVVPATVLSDQFHERMRVSDRRKRGEKLTKVLPKHGSRRMCIDMCNNTLQRSYEIGAETNRGAAKCLRLVEQLVRTAMLQLAAAKHTL